MSSIWVGRIGCMTNLSHGLIDQLVLCPLLWRVCHQPWLREPLLHIFASDEALTKDAVSHLNHRNRARRALLQEPGGLGFKVDVVGVEPRKDILDEMAFQQCLSA